MAASIVNVLWSHSATAKTRYPAKKNATKTRRNFHCRLFTGKSMIIRLILLKAIKWMIEPHRTSNKRDIKRISMVAIFQCQLLMQGYWKFWGSIHDTLLFRSMFVIRRPPKFFSNSYHGIIGIATLCEMWWWLPNRAGYVYIKKILFFEGIVDFKWCRWRESNSHGVAPTGFWDQGYTINLPYSSPWFQGFYLRSQGLSFSLDVR